MFKVDGWVWESPILEQPARATTGFKGTNKAGIIFLIYLTSLVRIFVEDAQKSNAPSAIRSLQERGRSQFGEENLLFHFQMVMSSRLISGVNVIIQRFLSGFAMRVCSRNDMGQCPSTTAEQSESPLSKIYVWTLDVLGTCVCMKLMIFQQISRYVDMFHTYY